MHFPIIQSDGTIAIVKPSYAHASCDNLRAVVQDDGSIEIVKDMGAKTSGDAGIVLDTELAANFDKFNSINLTSCYFRWWDWQTQGSVKIYNTGGGKKRIELYLRSIDDFHKRMFVEYEFFDNRIIISTYSCKRLLILMSVGTFGIAVLSIFIGLLLIPYDMILTRSTKKAYAKRGLTWHVRSNIIPSLLVFLPLFASGGNASAQDVEGHGTSRQPTIVINYVIDQYDRHFYLSQPQVEYLKIPDFPPPSHVPPGISGYYVLLSVATDGQGVVAVDLLGEHKGVEDLPESTRELAEELGTTISDADLWELVELAKENVRTWRFRKHEPGEFTTTWSFVLGEVIDDAEETDELDDILESDTATLDMPRNVEIVVFPKPPRGPGETAARSKAAPQVECLKIPEHPRQLRPGFKQDVTMRVKTDGRGVASAEVIGGTTSQVYRASSLDYVRTWTFKEHEPTEFVTHWKYDYETEFEPRPNVVTLDLPHSVEVKSFHVVEAVPVLRRKKMRRGGQK
jgi:hypothetical protein